jgi:hypothetical protein
VVINVLGNELQLGGVAALVVMIALAVFVPRGDDNTFTRQSLENPAHPAAQAPEPCDV